MRSGGGPVARSALLGACAVVIVAASVLTTTEVADGRTYRILPFELADDLAYDELPWTNERVVGLPAPPPRDAQGVPMERCSDGRLVYPMGALSINGMKRIDAYLDTGDAAQLQQALIQADRLRRLARRIGDRWWLPHKCTYPPEDQRAPWWNAMTQGLAISFFVRLYQVTGSDLHLVAARSVANTLFKLDRRERPWVSYVGAGGSLWLEHYPRAKPSHVLNAHLHTVIGLYELWHQTHDLGVRRLLLGAITTVRDHVARYRRPGELSLYDLRNRTQHVKYHEIHIWQLRFLSRITGDPYFWQMANTIASDYPARRRVPGKPLIQKKPPAPSGARRPRGSAAR
jgi:hypothetical protein